MLSVQLVATVLYTVKYTFSDVSFTGLTLTADSESHPLCLTQAADPEAWSTVACWSAPTGQAVLLAEAGPVDARLRLTGLVSEGDHREQGQDWTRTESYTTTIPGRAEIHLINIK